MKTHKLLRANPAKVRAWQDRSRKPLSRKAFWQTKKGTGLRRVAMKQRNEARIAKRAKQYRTVLASDFHKQLRYRAWERAGGLCECARCVEIRKRNAVAFGVEEGAWIKPAGGMWASDEVTAHSVIPVWFTKRGGEPYKRFRSTEGEIHHTTYKYLGKENPDELRFVKWMRKTCHQRIEAEHNTRRLWLVGGKNV